MREEISEHFDLLNKDFPEFDNGRLKQDRFQRYYYQFEYNEVIGWIRLYIFGTQIRGHYFFESDPKNPDSWKKRINKGIRKKKFVGFENKAFELSVYKEQNSQEIFNALLQELKQLNKNEKPFIKHYFDLEQLKNIGQFVDWRMLVSDLGF